MANGHIDRLAHERVGDPRPEWLAAVAAGQTILGLRDWMAARDAVASVSEDITPGGATHDHR